ncbi:MAG: zinc ribbon domain-containing protein [Eubacteriales bacterium]|nr:zinc ribbon domain-containing protein [Eubacteriales bacterium]
MFCSHCGAENPDGSTSCQKCGAQLAVAPAAPKKERVLPENKVYFWLVIAMFVSAFLGNWIAIALVFVLEMILVKDKWCLRNSIQPFAVGVVVVLCKELVALLLDTAIVTYVPVLGSILKYILIYSLELVRFGAIVFLVIGLISLLKGEVRIPLFVKLGDHFKDEK